MVNIIQHKNFQEESYIQVSLVNLFINLDRLNEKVLKKGKYVAIKCHNTSGDNDSGSYDNNLPYYRGGTPEDWLFWKDILHKALYNQSVRRGPESASLGDAKATFS